MKRTCLPGSSRITGKSVLIERNLRLVVYIASSRIPVLESDLVSIGTIGLIKAINTFNPSKNINWPLCIRCENEILMY